MGEIVQVITKINEEINQFVWGIPMMILLIGTGLLMTYLTGFFQITHFRHWISQTLGAVFQDKSVRTHTKKGDHAITQFQSLCTALAATVGTGNMAGVSTAIVTGGPGAIFWMWIVAFFGMMTHYAENVLGIYYRKKNERGEWIGGAMYYLKAGLGKYKGMEKAASVLSVLFCIFCILASFGIGNMAQINTITTNLNQVFSIPSYIVGLVLMIVSAFVVIGGLKYIARVTETIVPFMAVAYIIGALIVIIANAGRIPAVFAAIFKGAFGMKAVGGGIVGYGVKQAVTLGMKRGVFSNEAGLGSSVLVHCSSNVKEPVVQGLWGIFEVFTDTIVICTLTALVILGSGVVNLNTGMMLTSSESTALVSEAFATVFGPFGAVFIAIAILLFAYSTCLGWSEYGTRAFEYLFGRNYTIIFKVVFVSFIFVGATMKLKLAWDLSDTFNGLMAIPNLIGILFCSGNVVMLTKNYVDRKIHNKPLPPLYSAWEDIQKMQENTD